MVSQDVHNSRYQRLMRSQIFGKQQTCSHKITDSWENRMGGFSEGGFSNNRFVLKPDVAIASEVSILSKNSLAITDFHAKKTQHVQLFENPLPGTPPFAIPKTLAEKRRLVSIPVRSMPNMTGRPGCRTVEMIGASSVSYLARTPCVPLSSTLFNRGGSRRAFRLPGEGGHHFHCTVEPSPGHIRCR